MSAIPLFGFGMASKSGYVTAKLLTNMYCEQRPQGEKSAMVAFGTPGLNLFTDFGDTPPRGAIEFQNGGVDYVVHRDALKELSPDGTSVDVGTLSTSTGRVSMAHNGVQIFIVDGSFGYIYNTNTTVFARMTDADFPANPTTCCYLSQRFLVSSEDSGQFAWSDINDGTSWDALNFASAETNPDPIVCVYANSGQVVLLGTETTEFWGNSGVADPAFSAVQGSACEWGLAARWSVAKYDNSFACLMKNRGGQVMVAQMNGYLPKKLSTVDFDSIINAYAVTSDATAYAYMLGGHPMYCISFPSAGASWLFDGSTGIWSPLKSAGTTRHRGEFSVNLAGKTLVSDYALGRLYELTATALTDNGMPIEREVIGETIAAVDEELIDVACMRVDVETGVGSATGDGSDPQISLSISRDNGKTWGTEMWRSLGKTGEYATRVEWRKLGTCRYFTPKLRITDAVHVAIVRACLNPET
jgi:hypothetical protein